MLMNIIVVVVFAINPGVFLWLLRHSGHGANYGKLEEISKDYRYITVKCDCGKRRTLRVRGLRPFGLLMEELMPPRKKS